MEQKNFMEKHNRIAGGILKVFFLGAEISLPVRLIRFRENHLITLRNA